MDLLDEASFMEEKRNGHWYNGSCLSITQFLISLSVVAVCMGFVRYCVLMGNPIIFMVRDIFFPGGCLNLIMMDTI